MYMKAQFFLYGLHLMLGSNILHFSNFLNQKLTDV